MNMRIIIEDAEIEVSAERHPQLSLHTDTPEQFQEICSRLAALPGAHKGKLESSGATVWYVRSWTDENKDAISITVFAPTVGIGERYTQPHPNLIAARELLEGAL